MNKLNVPQLRFSGFEGEWEVKKLGDVVSNKSGKFNPIKEKHFTKCIELEHLSTETGKLLGFIDGRNSGSIKNKFNEGDVLFGKLRPYLKKYLLAPFDGVCSSEIWVLKGMKISNSFLYQIVQTNKFIDLANQSSGSKMPRADWNVVENGIFPFPTLSEQQKIASFLSAVDEKIQQLSRKKELLEQYKKGVMQQLFSGKLRFKDENGKDYPDWEEKRFGDIYTFYTTNSLSREKLNYEDGKVKNIHYGDIHTKFKTLFDINNEIVPFVNSDFDISKIKKECYCQEGDLVIADASEDYVDIGKSIEIINLKNEKVLAGLHTFLARPNKTRMYIGFSGYIVRSDNFRKQIMTIAQGSKVLSISTGRLAMLAMKIPTIEEQQKIANFLSSIDAKIENTNSELEKTQGFKKGLLQKMFV